jgi:hypothetical protein
MLLVLFSCGQALAKTGHIIERMAERCWPLGHDAPASGGHAASAGLRAQSSHQLTRGPAQLA